ncbi:hypothetical protein DCO58_06015 [Helicobacter saguini]|uniref:phosphoribosylglycinamide formyltransferase 1 n=1 Tax=Helicobacter saguini TaxID=1548018 RepID=A0A347W3U7_9HELI|nr:formyltransferase family protein [Helicobacter saguini]MWV62104.1 hypothetical protein [Helicobacter saguini]MWV67224.1 hypothetical protein [Helicobacter saguini]MWV69577.1 hypothetical protein [Helicobacter saguini]MWV70873.1 hypothetical protein [Helicobacter saguini]TLD94295.1 hypothetical protein LS64_006135 [Helicobacter saguini]
MKQIVILTSDSLRHTFMRKATALNSNIKVLKSYCETHSNRIYEYATSKIQQEHLKYRDLSEKDFFEPFVKLTPDYSNPIFIQKNEINEQKHIDSIISLNPDLIIAYGCSIIKEPLLNAFKHRILNVHLGLSPYYRGSGTNFFPFVNNELQYVGATFMYMDSGIDTGEIIHQIQADIYENDDIHKIGNRLITKIAYYYIAIINNFENLDSIKQPQDKNGKLYKNKDFTESSIEKINENMQHNMIKNYLQNKPNVKLYTNPKLDVKY